MKKPMYKLNLQMFAEGETVQELMQARAAIFDKQKKLVDTAKTEGRDLTDTEETEFNNLESEFAGYESRIAAAQKKENRDRAMSERENLLNQTQTPYRPAAVAGAPVQAEQKDNGGFKNLGEVIHAIRFGDPKGRLSNLPIGQGQGGGYGVPEAFHNLILPSGFKNQWSMGTGSEGGFAVPEQFNPEVQMIGATPSIVRPRAQELPAGDPPDAKLTMPALHQGSNGVLGGVEVEWIGEGEEKPDTGAALREVSLQPHEVAATTVVTDKLLRNWVAANAFISNLLRKAMLAAEDIAFLLGTGTNKPLGVLTAPGGIAVHRAQANKISYLDTVYMVAALLPESVAGAVWVANQSILPELVTLKDEAGNSIFIQGNAAKAIPATLSGIPIAFTGKTPVKGSKGDLMLLDLSYYLIKDGSGPFIAASEHVHFKQNKTVIKVFWNVDGKPWVIEPLTLENGITKVSPYVVLDIPSL